MKLSNLDLHGKFVKRGLWVSYGGLRYQVQKVNRGILTGAKLNAFGKLTGEFDRLICETVQVIKKEI